MDFVASFLTAETLGSLATVNTLLLNISPMTDEIPGEQVHSPSWVLGYVAV